MCSFCLTRVRSASSACQRASVVGKRGGGGGGGGGDLQESSAYIWSLFNKIFFRPKFLLDFER